MKQGLFSKLKTLSLREKIGIGIASALTAALAVAIPAAAWFSKQRQLADLQYVNSPTKLYILAGNGEESKYIDLSNVQVTGTTENAKYYVFAVAGSNAVYYNLQLAYTTNNQFEYFLYPATERQGTAPSSTTGPYVNYVAHGDSGTSGSYYYTVDLSSIDTADGRISPGCTITRTDSGTQLGSGVVSTVFLNQYGQEIRAKKDDTYHTNTYRYSAENVQDCAEPLYWQARNIKSGMNPTTRSLMDYYILEVNWEKARQAAIAAGETFTDNGETDIIYISVSSSTGSN
ncbi:MAG: hypothetical protein K5695_05845 [Oscillospiraceae bacterium]|nr:hypothetical protein [Oscillospiraceae bacterium]